jgi:hypothetical protein
MRSHEGPDTDCDERGMGRMRMNCSIEVSKQSSPKLGTSHFFVLGDLLSARIYDHAFRDGIQETRLLCKPLTEETREYDCRANLSQIKPESMTIVQTLSQSKPWDGFANPSERKEGTRGGAEAEWAVLPQKLASSRQDVGFFQ